jgi:hypothetical protein
MNPKGFFEIETQNIFLEVAFPDSYGRIAPPPSFETLDETAKKHAEAYRKLLAHEFRADFPIAVKAPRMLTLPFLSAMRDSLRTRLLVLDRNTNDQVRSLRRVWNQSDARNDLSDEDVRSFIESWKSFRDKVCAYYNFPVHRVQFEDLLSDPVATTHGITSFLDVPVPPEEEIRSWIDPDLANRDQLEMSNGGSSTLQRLCHKLGTLLLSYSEHNR